MRGIGQLLSGMRGFSFLTVTVVSVLLLAGAPGCGSESAMNPSSDGTADDALASVEIGIPTGTSSDPGILTAGPIDPPPLRGIDVSNARTVAMQFGNQRSTESNAAAALESNAAVALESKAAVALESKATDDESNAIGETSSTDANLAVLWSDQNREPAGLAAVAGEAPAVSPTLNDSQRPSEKIAEIAAVPASGTSSPAEPAARSDGRGVNPGPDAGDPPPTYDQWPKPQAALVFTGNQHGYIEPCGCTGLDRQKGGIARRFTLLESLRGLGWDVMPMDVGNQVRRFGRQASIKLTTTVKALRKMDYAAVGIGPDDVALGAMDLLAVAEEMYVSANVVLVDPELMPQVRITESAAGRIGVTSILDPAELDREPAAELLIKPMEPALSAALKQLDQSAPRFKVLMFFGKEEAAEDLVRQVPGFDLVVVAGGHGEPTFEAAKIDDSQTKMILTGAKAMHAGVIGLYDDEEFRYARVALTHEFKDAPPMRRLMADYQEHLKQISLEGLGLLPPIAHSSGRTFVGSETCGECHTEAYDIWLGTPHAEATAHIVEPPEERGDVARHFDPECISCHVTGWNPQKFYPYQSGYLSLAGSENLHGSGCENCHGPGAEHAAAEQGTSTASAELRQQLRVAMRLPLEQAREKCLECHDLDNSPDFHDEDAFEDIYWPQVEHYGMD